MCHLFLGYIWIKNGNCIESVCLISRKVAGECVRGRLVGKKGKQNKRRPSSDRRAWAIILLCVIIWLPTSCHFWFQSHPETWKSYSGMSQILAVHKLLFYSHGFFFSGIFPVFSGSGEICAHTLPSSCPLWPPAPSPPSPLPEPWEPLGLSLIYEWQVCAQEDNSHHKAPLPSVHSLLSQTAWFLILAVIVVFC